MPSPEALRAADPATPADELRRLASRDDCKEAVAGNPGAPIDVLCKLSAEHADLVLANPTFELSLLADPRLLAQRSFDEVQAIMGSARCSLVLVNAMIPLIFSTKEGRLGYLFFTFDETLFDILLERPDLDDATLQRLFDEASLYQHEGVDYRVAERLAGDPRPSPGLLARFARVANPSVELVELLLQNPSFPRREIPRLLEIFPERIGLLLAEAPDTSPDVVMRLIGSSSPAIRRMARANPNLPAPFGELLDRLGFPPSMETSAIPPDSPMSAEDMESLYEGGAWFQFYLARRPDLSPSLRERMQQTDNPMLRQLLKRYPPRQGTP